MDSASVVWVAIISIGVAAYLLVRSLEKRLNEQRASVATLENEVAEIREKVSEFLARERAGKESWIIAEKSAFDQCKPLLAENVSSLPSGKSLKLKMRTYTEQGTPLVYDVEYVHGELAYRSSNERDPIAYGTARYKGDPEFKDARILFSKPDGTASLKGLALEGNVRISN